MPCLESAYPNQMPPHQPNRVINQRTGMQILIVAGAGSVSPDIMIAIYLRERTQRAERGAVRLARTALGLGGRQPPIMNKLALLLC